jgi:hypothetical protein
LKEVDPTLKADIIAKTDELLKMVIQMNQEHIAKQDEIIANNPDANAQREATELRNQLMIYTNGLAWGARTLAGPVQSAFPEPSMTSRRPDPSSYPPRPRRRPGHGTTTATSAPATATSGPAPAGP